MCGELVGKDITPIKDYAKALIESIQNPSVQAEELISLDVKVAEFFSSINNVNLSELDESQVSELNRIVGSFHKAVVNKSQNMTNKKVRMAEMTTTISRPSTNTNTASRVSSVPSLVESARAAWKDLIRSSESSEKISSLGSVTKNTQNLAPGEVRFEEKEVKFEKGVAKLQSMRISSMRLYHGSAVSGIKEFKAAEETTVGEGVYLTSHERWGVGYAFARIANREGKPTVYEAEIQNMNLLNLSTKESLTEFMKFYRRVLFKEIKSLPPDAPWYWRDVLVQKVDEIDKALEEGRSLYPKQMLQQTGHVATRELAKLGYDGIFTIEGGETGVNPFTKEPYDMGNHDSFVIFDPKKVKITREIEVTG
jgi:hypothetical protein